jgi:hypothetical protein
MDKWVVYVLVVFSVVLSGCIEELSSDGGSGGTMYVCPDGKTVVKSVDLCPKREYVCPDKSIVDDPDKCNVEKDDDVSICNKLADSYSTSGYSSKDSCFLNFATSKGQPELCNRIVQTYTRSQCYTSVAQSLGNSSVCNAAGTYKNDCYSAMASNMRDASLCDKITLPVSRDACLSNLVYYTRDESICVKMTSPYSKDSCYSTLATYNYDSDFCAKIKTPNTKDNCFRNIAYTMRDSSLCDKISTAGGIESCRKYVNGSISGYGGFNY